MSKKLVMTLMAAAGVALSVASVNAVAQSKQGYWTEPAGGDAVWKNATGLCWRDGYWTPAMAIAECDPDLVPKPAAQPAKPAAQPAKPAAKPVSKSASKPAAKPSVSSKLRIVFPLLLVEAEWTAITMVKLEQSRNTVLMAPMIRSR